MSAILWLEDIKWSATCEKQLKLAIPVRFELMFHVEHWSIRFSTNASPKWEHMSPSLKT
jgi:hypothetical protein